MTNFLSQVAQITPNLYLSGFVGASESTVLKYGITCIITVCKEVPKLSIPFVESIKLDVLDKPNEQLDRYFDYVGDKINDVVTRKGSCLVHCVAGISRSASMIIVYLMKYQNMSLKDAHELVKSKRHFIRPNLGFWKQLVDYERKIFGKNSVKIISSSIGFIPDLYENEIKNMVWATPNGLVVSNSPSGMNTNKPQAVKQSTSSANSTTVPTTTAVLNLNSSPTAGTRANRAYYQTTYSSSYCAQSKR
jgi:atypical dual specificity phosphatase